MPSNADIRYAHTLNLDAPVSCVKGISTARAAALRKKNINTVGNLLETFPRHYVDMTNMQTALSAPLGQVSCIVGTVKDVKLKRPRPTLPLVEITLTDNTGFIMVTCFRQPWLMNTVQEGATIAVAGKVEFSYGCKRMTNPHLEVLETPEQIAQYSGTIVPVHPASEKIPASTMRALIKNALDTAGNRYDPLPVALREKYGFMSKRRALSCIHFPRTMAEAEDARTRLAYEEIFLLEMELMSQRALKTHDKLAVAHCVEGHTLQEFLRNLPFTLTDDQACALDDIKRALSKDTCANHLVLGDVGTGKTALAAAAVCMAKDSNAQAMFMAPTEVLAQQHFAKLEPLFRQVGVRAGLLCGSTSAEARQQLLTALAAGELDVLIGTHALLEPDVCPLRLSLVIIDEQQRFGVDQRAALVGKASLAEPRLMPDALYLTATPIPRSLALAVFGDLTLSYLHTKPHATAPIITMVLQKEDLSLACHEACQEIERGHQVYVVCPLVGKGTEERNDMAEGNKRDVLDAESSDYFPAVSIEDESDFVNDDVTAATALCAQLQRTFFGSYQVALLHGKMSAAEKRAVMAEFQAGDIDVLVATTVIEVGVDVPNATVMIVEDADRFGLSQLHQLRGRVGRGNEAGKAFLLSSSTNEVALRRLKALEDTNDGFELAEIDLSIRREGDLLGNKQSGTSTLALVRVMKDAPLIEAARADAAAIIETDPLLKDPLHAPLRYELKRIFERDATVVGG